MKHAKEGPNGDEHVAHVDCDPRIPPKPEELAAGGGGGTAVPPADAGGVEVENWLMNLPNHPRGEGWLK